MLKPDNKTALSPLYGVALLEEAGLPKGLFQVVCGEGPDVGPTLIDNANYVMFTGSTATGRVIGERAGRNLIGCCLELGGKNPMIVLEDAEPRRGRAGRDVRRLRQHRPDLHAHRADVPARASKYDDFKGRFVAATEALTLGASYDFGPEVGSLVSPDHKDRVQSHVEDAVAKGATVLTGGQARPDLGPAFFEPTILEGVTKDMLAGVTETFGPVVALHRTRPSTRRSRWPTTPTTASTPGVGRRPRERAARSAGGSSPATSTSTTSSPRRSPRRAHRPVASSSRASVPATATRAC